MPRGCRAATSRRGIPTTPDVTFSVSPTHRGRVPRHSTCQGCRSVRERKTPGVEEVMRLLACLVIVVAACDRGPTPPEPPEAPDFNFATVAALGDPISGITSAELELFRRGRAVFTRTFTPKTGVGPLFNDVGCVECHDLPAVGGNGTQVEVHASAFVDGRCDELFGRGGPVIQTQVTPALPAALGITSDPVPPAATGPARRTAPDIFGFGLLDAVPDAAILR